MPVARKRYVGLAWSFLCKITLRCPLLTPTVWLRNRVDSFAKAFFWPQIHQTVLFLHSAWQGVSNCYTFSLDKCNSEFGRQSKNESSLLKGKISWASIGWKCLATKCTICRFRNEYLCSKRLMSVDKCLPQVLNGIYWLFMRSYE